MTANPTTDQYAAHVSASRAANPDVLGPLDETARSMAARLVELQPDLDPRTIGAVTLHVASCLGGVLVAVAAKQGIAVTPEGVLAINLVGLAGQQLYTGGAT